MIMKKILGSSTHAMESAMEKNSAAKLDEASGFLLRANKICFFGMGGSYALAEDAYHKFIRTGILCDVSSDLHWQYMYSAMMKKDDVVVLFSNSGSNKDLIELTDYLWEREIKVITITQSDQTPLAKKSSVNLICSGEESAMRTEAMESRFSSLMLIDILFVICMKNRQDVTLRILNQIREGIANRRI